MTAPEVLDARDPSLTVEYVVELRNTYARFRRATTDIIDLLHDVKEGIWRSGAAH